MPMATVNGVDLYHEVHGAGEPLLLIHGLGSSARDWGPQIAAFSKTHRVIVFDLRGHGQSSRAAAPYGMDLLAADAANLLLLLDSGPAHVVGLSLGGCVAFQMALDAPSLVRTLTVVNSAPEVTLNSLRQRVALWQRLTIVRLMGMRRMGRVLSRRLFIGPGQSELRKTFVARWAGNDRAAYLAALRAMLRWSVSDRLDTIRCPTLVIASEHDYTPLSLKEEYVARLPDARLVVIPDARHAVPAERPEPFNRALRRFLEAVPAVSPGTPRRSRPTQ